MAKNNVVSLTFFVHFCVVVGVLDKDDTYNGNMKIENISIPDFIWTTKRTF